MIKDLLKVVDVSETETKTLGDSNHHKLAFQLEIIADRLELMMENTATGKSLDSECYSLEEDCEKLREYLYRETFKDRIPRYQQMLTLMSATKVALSEIYFGSSFKMKLEFNQDNNNKHPETVHTNMLTVKNNNQKMRTISQILAVS